jgi:hypothetical protein
VHYRGVVPHARMTNAFGGWIDIACEEDIRSVLVASLIKGHFLF